MGDVQHNSLSGADLHISKNRYFPRRANVPDKTAIDFIKDAANHVNGLDLSAIVPADAVGVILGWSYKSGILSNRGFIWTDVTNFAMDYTYLETKVVAREEYTVDTLPIDSDRLMDYNVSITTAFLDLTVLGWFT